MSVFVLRWRQSDMRARQSRLSSSRTVARTCEVELFNLIADGRANVRGKVVFVIADASVRASY